MKTFLSIICISIATTLISQESSNSQLPSDLYYFNISIGYGDDLFYYIEPTILFKNKWGISGNYMHSNTRYPKIDIESFPFQPNEPTYYELNVSYVSVYAKKCLLAKRKIRVDVELGPSYIHATKTTYTDLEYPYYSGHYTSEKERFNNIGISGKADLELKLGDNVGLSLGVIGNLNEIRKNGGITLGLCLGNFW